jgi:myo-inositol 2-dehydrogenase/D-chiro-inositol 1-dehydrogenase
MFTDAYVAEMSQFADAIRTGSAPPVTGEDARNALRVALAAMKSHEERRPIQLDELG